MRRATKAEKSSPVLAPLATNILQRQCDCGQHASASGQCSACREESEKTLRRSAISSNRSTTEVSPKRSINENGVPAIVRDVLRSPGEALDANTRTFMEPRFGHDFSGVRIHTDSKAAASARAVRALAYTVGRDVVFDTGRYAPHTAAGKGLIAHELAHVVQQRNAGDGQLAKLAIGDCNDSSEREADQQAHAVLSGGDARPMGLSSSPTMIRRACGVAGLGPAPADCSLTAAPPSGSRFKFNVDCDDFAPGERARLQTFARGVRASTPTATINIIGLASFDGDAGLNHSLACHRATKAADIVRPEVASVGTVEAQVGDASTAGNAEFRAADIQVIAPAPPQPAPQPAPPQPAPPQPAPPQPETITSETVETQPANRARTDIGVGELVTLTHAPGAAAWSVSPAGAGTFSVANGVTTIYTAPDTAQRVTITGGTATIVFDIKAPTTISMDRQPGTGVQHTTGRPDSGIQTRVFLGPDTVNFHNVIYHEMDVTGTGTGVFSCNPTKSGHCGAGGAGAACPDKTVSNTVVAGMGTQSTLGDCALSGDCCKAAVPFVAGSEGLSIPYEYKVGAGAFHPITNVPQSHSLGADLTTLTSSKGGASGSTTVTAASASIAQCPIGHC